MGCGPRAWLWRSWVSSSRTSARAARAVVEIVPSAAVGRGRVGGCRVAGTVGLGDHDREGVRDDVVHVAGDPHALLFGRRFGLGPLLGITVRARPQGGAHERADRPRQQQRERGRDEDRERERERLQRQPAAGEGRPEEQVDRDDERAEQRRGEPGPVHATAAVGGGDVEHAEDRDVGRGRRAPEPHLQHGSRPGERERERRRQPADREGGAEDQGDERSREICDRDAEQADHPGLADHDLDRKRDGEERHRDGHVDDELVRLQPAEHRFTLRDTPSHGIRLEMYPPNHLPRVAMSVYCPDTG